MSRRALHTFLIALTTALGACEAVAPDSVELRENPDVLPFVPVCTACMAWSFAGQRWALHRSRAQPDELEATDESEAMAAPLELVAVRFQPNGVWWQTDDAQSYALGDFVVYTWPGRALEDTPPSESSSQPQTDELEQPDEPDSDKPLRTAEVWIVRDDTPGVCEVPWLGGRPLPEEKPLSELIDGLDIERQGCAAPM